MSDQDKEKAIAKLQRQLLDLQENRAGALKVIDRDPDMRELVERLDRQIAEVRGQLRELRPATAGEELAELETKIATSEAKLRELSENKSAAVVAKLQRDPTGAARLKQIEEQSTAVERGLQSLRDQHGQLRQRIATDRAEGSRKAAGARPLRLAKLHRERAALSEMAATAAATLAAAFRAIEANGAAICEQADELGIRNFFSGGAFRSRANNAFARAFAINPNAPLTASNSLFGLASRAVGDQARWTLAEWEQPGLDDLLPFFLTEAEAEAAQQRLELRSCPTIIVPLHGAFTLVRFEHVFGDERTARRAARDGATPMSVLPIGEGFVLIPERFTAEAA